MCVESEVVYIYFLAISPADCLPIFPQTLSSKFDTKPELIASDGAKEMSCSFGMSGFPTVKR